MEGKRISQNVLNTSGDAFISALHDTHLCFTAFSALTWSLWQVLELCKQCGAVKETIWNLWFIFA